MDDSKHMFSSKLSSESVWVPVSPLNMGAAQESLECHYQLIINNSVCCELLNVGPGSCCFGGY